MNYNDEELIDKCSKLLNLMVLNSEELSMNGLDITQFDLFASRLSAFRQIPSDNTLRNLLLETQRQMRSKRMELLVTLRHFENSARFAWGNDEKTYKVFHQKNLPSIPDMDLLLFSRKVRVATDQNFYILAQFGMTTTKRNNLQKLNDDFFTALKNFMRAAKFNGNKKMEKSEKSITLQSNFNQLANKSLSILEKLNKQDSEVYKEIKELEIFEIN